MRGGRCVVQCGKGGVLNLSRESRECSFERGSFESVPNEEIAKKFDSGKRPRNEMIKRERSSKVNTRSRWFGTLLKRDYTSAAQKKKKRN